MFGDVDRKDDVRAILFLLLLLTLLLQSVPSIPVSSIEGEGCTSVIVTGSASKGEWAILAKNRDCSDIRNGPVYVPSRTFTLDGETYETYAYTAINTYWMGMNEKGLAEMNTLMSALSGDGQGHAWGNGELNQKILELCETVEEVCEMLNDTDGIIGPNNRDCATCIGVLDRFGNGAFIEVSPTEAYVEHVVDGYQSRANHPRVFPGKASGPIGRDQYALDIMNEIFSSQGFISYPDVMQKVVRYVHHKEEGSDCFSIIGELCNPSTHASFVAVSGDQRYDGKLNCFWGEYGNPPMVGLFVPSIPFAGEPPTVLSDLYEETWLKRSYAQETCGYYYSPEHVREVQSFTFEAESYTFEQYEHLIATIPSNMNSSALEGWLEGYVNDAVQYATDMYIASGNACPSSVGGRAWLPVDPTLGYSTLTVYMGFSFHIEYPYI